MARVTKYSIRKERRSAERYSRRELAAVTEPVRRLQAECDDDWWYWAEEGWIVDQELREYMQYFRDYRRRPCSECGRSMNRGGEHALVTLADFLR